MPARRIDAHYIMINDPWIMNHPGAPAAEDLAAFCQRIRRFVATALPADIRRKVEQHLELERDDYVRWQKILHAHGLMGGHWPTALGGQGWRPLKRWAFEQCLYQGGAPWLVPMGVAYVGPVIGEFGTREQQGRFLPRILAADDFWCQGYSEPNAGSDLASLRTTARRDGDVYLVNGQKIWTTFAHWADWIFCLVRTSSDGKPQSGISFLLIDMRSPGITVRPITTIDGLHHVNEVFFDDVRVPAGNLIGAEGDGWTCAKFLLVQERLISAETGKARLHLRQLRTLAAEVRDGGIPLADNPVFARRIAQAEIDLRALEAVCGRLFGRAERGAPPGVEANMLKIRGTELLQAIGELTIEATGRAGLPFDPAALAACWRGRDVGPAGAGGFAGDYLYGRAMTIWGGANEIQRGIIARQGLGLA